MSHTRPEEGPKTRITIVLPGAMLERVKALAERKATPPSILIRQWIAERIEQEGNQ